jgi:hypothetical protein
MSSFQSQFASGTRLIAVLKASYNNIIARHFSPDEAHQYFKLFAKSHTYYGAAGRYLYYEMHIVSGI